VKPLLHPPHSPLNLLPDSVETALEQRLELAYEQEQLTGRASLFSRRSLLWMASGLLGTALLGTGYARWVEPTRYRWTRSRCPSPGCPNG
jgi:hypothetical protein